MRPALPIVFVRPGEKLPSQAAACPTRPWPEGVVSTGVPLMNWRKIKRALAQQPQLRPFQEHRS